MTVVNPKSISGINSITTGSGSDNLLTIHTSDASNTERFRIDSTGTTKIVTGIVTTLTATGSAKVGTGITLSPDGDIFATGVCTATSFSGDGSALTGIDLGAVTGATGDFSIADKIVHTGDTNTAIRFPAADTITAETGGSERIRIDSSGNTNFGAEKSVTLPSGTGIQVYNSSTPRIKLVNDTTGNGSGDGLQIYMSGSSAIFDQKESAETRFYTAGTERIRINSDGRSYFVGGSSGGYSSTTLPNGNTVNINTKVSNDGVSVIRYSGSYAAYALNIGRSKSDNIGTNSIVANGDDLGHITWYGADGTDFNQAAAISAQVDGSPSDGTDMPGRIVFKTSADGSGTPAERLRIASNGDLLYASSDRNYASWYHTPTNSSSNAATSSTESLIFGSSSIANTDVYNTSNGRYTAPVDGLYFLRFNGLIDNNGGQAGYTIKALKNGSVYGPNIAYHTRLSEDSTNRYQLLSGSAIMYMAANDYATIYATAGMHTSQECNFFVYLIRGTI